jgi:hypothetical protein
MWATCIIRSWTAIGRKNRKLWKSIVTHAADPEFSVLPPRTGTSVAPLPTAMELPMRPIREMQHIPAQEFLRIDGNMPQTASSKVGLEPYLTAAGPRRNRSGKCCRSRRSIDPGSAVETNSLPGGNFAGLPGRCGRRPADAEAAIKLSSTTVDVEPTNTEVFDLTTYSTLTPTSYRRLFGIIVSRSASS